MIANRYERCRDFLYRRRLHLTGVTPGSDEWDALDDADGRKVAALAALGLRTVLEQELDELKRIRAEKDAAVAVAGARDWSRLSTDLRRRAEFVSAHPWARRIGGAA